MRVVDMNRKPEGRVLMKCGHVATGMLRPREGEKGGPRPVCVSCYDIDPGADQVVDIRPVLDGRRSRCAYFKYCKNEVPSDYNLPFFAWKGEGSPAAKGTCKVCAFFEEAHKPEASKPITDHEFVPHGAYDFDEHYCGCRGWD